MFASHKVQIIEFSTRKVVKEIACTSEREGERIERGILINFNHAEYGIKIVKAAVLVSDKKEVFDVISKSKNVLTVKHGVTGWVYEIFYTVNHLLTVIDDAGFHRFEGFGNISPESVEKAVNATLLK